MRVDDMDDLLCARAIRDPYPGYAALRDRPVRWNSRWHGWVVTGYPECQAVIRDAAAFSSEKLANHAGSDAGRAVRLGRYRNLGMISSWVSFTDPPDHTRLRRLISGAFTPASIEALRPSMRRRAERMVDALPVGTEFDLVDTLTCPFPLGVITELLGLAERDSDRFRAWSDALRPVVLGGAGSDRRHERADQALGELADYLRAEIADRRRFGRADLLTSLVRAGDRSQRLTDEEIVGSCMILLFGGHETSANLLANALLALADHPDQSVTLRGEPGLIGPAVEEFLRYDGPTKGVVRWAVRDVQVGGVPIAAGQRVLALIAAANRDPRQFDRPDRLHLRRSPNRHLEFGSGIHHCVGAALARAEAEVMLPMLLDRFDYQIDRRRLAWEPTMLSRSLRRFPVLLGERTAR